MTSALLTTYLPNLTWESSGKVCEIYSTSLEDCLLVVAMDRRLIHLDSNRPHQL